jgi:hypothetical protein
VQTLVGPVPRARTSWSLGDTLGAWRIRWDLRRDSYRVDPGLYAVGDPDADSPVLVTANYKYTFDVLRRELGGVPAWVLVLDTRGINVWCAAGKKRFSSAELVRRIASSDLAQVVAHHQVVVPQLGATGVAAHEVRRQSGFRVVWGPVLARDIPRFIDGGMKATPDMREVRFGLWARVQLVPVELVAILRHGLWAAPLLAALGMLGPWLFASWAGLAQSLPVALYTRAVPAVAAYLLGSFAGAVVAPALLPWIPGRQFWLKGVVTGGVLCVLAGTAAVASGTLSWVAALGLGLVATAVSSWATMNFTGSTTFTSPTGVEAEMRRGIPVQAALAAAGVAVWIVSAWF